MNEKEEKNEELEIDIITLIQNALIFLKRLRWLIALLVIALGVLLPVVNIARYTPTYRAYCSFSVKVINNAAASDLNSLYGMYYDKDLAEQLEKTFTYILGSDLVSDAVKEDLGNQISTSNIVAKCIKGSNIFELSAYAKTPDEAGRMLESVMSIYEETAKYVIGALEVEMIEEIMTEDTPSGKPNMMKDACLGALLGLGIGILIIVVMAFLHNTIQKPGDLEIHLNMPCLGVVPITDIKKHTMLDFSSTHSEGEFRECIRGIARKLDEKLKKDGTKVILVSSTVPEEGKSTISLALAEIIASWGKKTALVDGDLRKPTLHRRLGLKTRDFPLEKVIKGDFSIDSLMLQIKSKDLYFFGNSTSVEDPTVLINSNYMKTFINQISERVDCVIIDTPPCEMMSDAALYQEYADGILYVIRQDYVPVNDILNAIDGLVQSDSKLLGYVLNGVKQTTSGYGKYGYGKYSYGKYGYGYYGKYGYGYGYGYSSKSRYHGYGVVTNEKTDSEGE